ncbi:MAG: FAD-dependent monooxygenase [Proteobacteria bacterium]|nr:FAD-dependent monooxygenase [Pseudomonadota bacterium]
MGADTGQLAAADVAIVGGGFAGALLALVLARGGEAVTVVDLHETYPEDFRCEKLSPAQVQGMADLGVLDALASLAPEGEALTSVGLRYEWLVRALRAAWPEAVTFIPARVERLETSEDRQAVVLSDGRQLDARLIVIASGPMSKLAEPLGVQRRTLRKRHSLCVGFSVVSAETPPRPLPALAWHGERPGDGMGFVSLFPMRGAMRANLFAYRDPTSAWARGGLQDPIGALYEAMPGLKRRLGPLTLVSPVETRATDLYQVDGVVQPGVVLIGDAFRSSCPATGMGVSRIVADVTALVGMLPAWLATPGMGAGKIAAYYADPAKREVDHTSDRRSETGRRVALETSLRWRARRGLARLKRDVTALARRA